MPAAKLIVLDVADHAVALIVHQHDDHVGGDFHGRRQLADHQLRAAVADDAPLTLRPGERDAVPTGLAMAIPTGFVGQVRPRSGLALKNGVTCLNSPGTVDSDYRGEVKVILVNHGEEDFTIRRGDRIAQLRLVQRIEANFEEVLELAEAPRGAAGFGSTGV